MWIFIKVAASIMLSDLFYLISIRFFPFFQKLNLTTLSFKRPWIKHVNLKDRTAIYIYFFHLYCSNKYETWPKSKMEVLKEIKRGVPGLSIQSVYNRYLKSSLLCWSKDPEDYLDQYLQHLICTCQLSIPAFIRTNRTLVQKLIAKSSGNDSGTTSMSGRLL